MTVDESKGRDAYARAGVDIQAGNDAVERMKRHVESTRRPEVMGGLGGFGALFRLDLKRYRQPVLVSGSDGVGTKLKIAFAMDRHDSIGIDAVAMCVNDVVVQGAEPLFFLDYLACDRVIPEKVEQIVAGISRGCQMAGCALIGGETAEMPGLYAAGEYDVAGFVVGAVEEENLVDGSQIQAGDAVLGLTSSGLHSNGYSLVRRLLLEEGGYSLHQRLPQLDDRILGEVLLEPTRIYVRPVLQMLQEFSLRGLAHITGGGLLENVPRVLPEGFGVQINLGSWPVPPIFALLQEVGRLGREELFRTFNMGIGMVLILPEAEAEGALQRAAELGEEAHPIGRVVSGKGVELVTE